MRSLIAVAAVAASMLPASASASSLDKAEPASTQCRPKLVGASVFTGSTGYRGDNLNRTPAYAELGMGRNLGRLPRGFRLRISYYSRSVIARKFDIGLGGGPVFGYRRDIDLHDLTRRRLGFPWGVGLVRVVPARCPS